MLSSEFNPKKGKLADYGFLKFWIKPESPGIIDDQLPQSDSKRTMKRTFEIAGDNWRSLQMNLNNAGKQKIVPFFYYSLLIPLCKLAENPVQC